MTLEVKADALRSFNTALQAWSTSTTKATSYVKQHLVRSDAMFFHNVVAINDQVVTPIKQAIHRIEGLTRVCGQELVATAKMYDETDEDAAGRLETKYEAVDLGLSPEADPAPFGEFGPHSSIRPIAPPPERDQ